MSPPLLVSGGVAGSRCASCSYPAAPACPRCPACGGPSSETVFSPRGTVWASTLLHIGVAGRQPPFAFAYVDLDDGPRVLAPLEEARVADVGAPVVLIPSADHWCLAVLEENK
ncbi:Zn-ribbon domain-containing OB-fold protein [Acrocarpospora catenulata]|uniref:Zn-ribbon domain-containing OB-fold protein n=1 Tax=Acrocarpospora catenulata TaxID=2836182 RepID=UPI001BD9D35D|nr:OB-fold domain-containing protein [Acrocarpospora catenulata]